MNLIGIFIGLVGVMLIFSVIWMTAVSAKQKLAASDKKARAAAHRKAIQRNHAQEKQELLQKAEENHLPSILLLAKQAELKDFKEAIFWYEKAALLGNATGMYGVVRLCSRFGQDPIMVENARFWKTYIKGIEGDMSALFEAGKALLSGLGVNKNHKLGIKVIQDAAHARHIDAQLFLGDWCLSDDSPKEQVVDANYWYAKAAQLENHDGMIKLGLNYVNGRGVTKDHKKGCFWLECAAERGNTKAMYHAGKAWIDVGKHGDAISYIWLYMSSQCNYSPARSLRDEVANKLGVDSIVSLQAFADPLLKKLVGGTVHRHLIIRALNRLYKRGIPIPESRISAEDPNDNGDEVFLSQLLSQERFASSREDKVS
ncbi:tetratricopeptide repeat protein [Vibrio sp. WJH972]